MSEESSDMHPDIAAAIEKEHPHWLVLWGAYSREFWAFPLLPVPRGTLVHAVDPDMLVTAMQEVELAASQKPAPNWTARQPGTEGMT